MSPLQEKPVIHGRDHSHGGPDPSFTDWEDVGGSGGGTTPDTWPPYVIFHGSLLTYVGGAYRMAWDASPVGGNDPDGVVAARHSSLTHVIQLLTQSEFSVSGTVHIGNGGGAVGMSADVIFELQGGVDFFGWFGASFGIAHVWPGGSFGGGPMFMPIRWSGGADDGTLQVMSSSATALTPIEMVLCITKMK